MTTLNQRVYQTVGRHFVTLSCVQRHRSDSTERVFVFSGFLIDVDGEWFYVTAGHIVRDIRKSMDAGDTFDVWRLGDQTAGNKFKGISVPYHFEGEHWLVIEDADIGLDYAAVHLRDLYRRALAVGGIVPIGSDAWADHVAEHDLWALVGIPSETVKYDGETIITAKIVVTPVTSTSEPEMAGRKAQNQFYAKLSDDSTSFMTDVDGMSGGPVFALKKTDGSWKYGVIGIQSAWYPKSRILAICPFSSFGNVLEAIVREARSNAHAP